MPVQTSDDKSRPAARHTWHLLGSRYSLSIWVGVLFVVPSLVSAVLLIDSQSQGQWWQDVLFALLTWVAPLGFLALIRALWFPVRKSSSAPARTLAVFLGAGMVRGAVIYWVGPLLGLTAWTDPVTGFLSEIVTIAAALAIIAVVISARMTYQDALTRLASDREELLELQMGAAEAFHAQRDSLLVEAQGILAPILESLRGSLSQARDARALATISDTMRDAVDDIVRPLSTALAQRSPQIERRSKLVPYAGSRLVDANTRVTLSQFILPFTFTASMFIMSTGALVVVLGMQQALWAVALMSVILYSVLWLARLVARQARFSAYFATALYVTIHFIAGVVFVVVIKMSPFNVALNLLIGWLLVVIGVAYLLMRYQLVEWVRADVIKKQEAVNAELEITLSGLRQQLRVESRRIAMILHGPVQTALYAAAIRVASKDRLDDSLAQEIVSDLETAMRRLENEVVAPLPLKDFVAEVSRVWGESVTITFRQDDPAREAIATSPTALACLTEVIREGVNNAIKHASASEISIDVFVVEPMLVEVTVVNPSQPEALSVSPGFGTDYLNNLTHDWSLTDDGNNTTLWAAVALDQS